VHHDRALSMTREAERLGYDHDQTV
jgi:hypothetical protein